MHCPHCSAPLVQPLAAPPIVADPGSFSTATERQEQRILDMLREGPKTSPQLAAAGCVQYTARIHGLRARGFDIKATRYNGLGLDNQWHKGLALYRLESEPPSHDEKGSAC